MENSNKLSDTFSLESEINSIINTYDYILNTDTYENISNQQKMNINNNKQAIIKIIKYIFSKSKFTQTYANFLAIYISSFSKITQLILSTIPNISSLLVSLAYIIKLETLESNTIIAKTGNVVNKCFLIINGFVSALNIIQYKTKMTKSEYISHLHHLNALNETDLLYQTIELNKHLHLNWEINDEDFIITTHNGRNVDNYTRIDSIQMYVQSITASPKEMNCNEDEYENVVLCTYVIVSNFENGDIINEHVLEKNNLNTNIKSKFTFVTRVNSLLMSINSKIYYKCVKKVKNKSKQNHIENLLSSALFYKVNKHLFIHNYYGHFTIKTYNQGEYIFKQGSKINEITIIQNGEVELLYKSTFNTLENTIKIFQGDLIYSLFFDNLFSKRKCLNTIGNRTTIQKIYIMKRGDVLGLDDVIIDNNTLFSARIISNKCKVYCIDMTLFIEKFIKDLKINGNVDKIVKKQKELYLERLYLIRKVMLNEYVVVKGEGIYHKNDKSCLSPKEERMKWLKEVGEIREGCNVKMIHKCNSLLKLPVKLSTNSNNNNNRLIGKNISKLRNKSLNYDESVDKFTNSSLRNLLYNHSNNNSNINNSSDTTTHNESRAKEHKKTDALLYKVLGIRHKPYYLRQYNSISSSIFSPLSSSINNSINDFKDEYTFNNNNNELVFDNKQIIKVVPNMIVKSNNNIIEKEMNAEMERLRVRRNPFKIIGIDNKEVTLQHILMHKIGRNLDENGMEIKRKSEKGNNNKMVDFLAMDKYVEVVQRGRSCEERRILKGFKYRK